MNRTQAGITMLTTALVACFCAVNVVQAMQHLPALQASAMVPAAWPAAPSHDPSVPSATAVFAATPVATADEQAPTF